MAFYLYDGKFLLDDGKFAISEDCCCGGLSACYKLVPCQDASNTCNSCDPPLPDFVEMTIDGLGSSDIPDGTYILEWDSGCYWDLQVGFETLSLQWIGGSVWQASAWPSVWQYDPGPSCDFYGGVSEYIELGFGQGTVKIEPLGTNTTVSGQIIVDNDLSAVSGVINYGDECYNLIGETACSGAITMGSYDVYDDCESCYAPSSCPTGLTGNYEIDGYTDGDLSTCTSCQDFNIGWTVWDGVFPYSSSCVWEATNIEINGKEGQAGMLLSSGKWVISINCYNTVPAPDIPIWVGEKITGANPTGIYTRTGGCDTTTAISVVEV